MRRIAPTVAAASAGTLGCSRRFPYETTSLRFITPGGIRREALVSPIAAYRNRDSQQACGELAIDLNERKRTCASRHVSSIGCFCGGATWTSGVSAQEPCAMAGELNRRVLQLIPSDLENDPKFLTFLAANVPKAELHIHIEGALEPELALKLAARNNVTEVLSKYDSSVAKLRESYNFSDLQSFLNVYYDTMQVLRTADDFFCLTRAYLEQARIQHVRHVELFFDGPFHVRRGVRLSSVIDGIRSALENAEAEWGLSWRLLMCLQRELPPEEALHCVRQIGPYRPWIHGIGLDGAEKPNPPERFADAFNLARSMGLHCVAHAGEEGPPPYIYTALNVLHVERIDHGVRAVEDPSLLEMLRVRLVPLTVCPLSNWRLRVVESLAQHPIKELMDAGLCVTLNSDDPAYFGGYINENFSAMIHEKHLNCTQVLGLLENSFVASFLEPNQRNLFLGEQCSAVESCVRTWQTDPNRHESVVSTA